MGYGSRKKPIEVEMEKDQALASDIHPSARAFRLGRCFIIVALEPIGWHLSISHPDRYPSWDEIKKARYALVPDEVTMAMLLPPRNEYVNLHDNCFHLHQIKLAPMEQFQAAQ